MVKNCVLALINKRVLRTDELNSNIFIKMSMQQNRFKFVKFDNGKKQLH